MVTRTFEPSEKASRSVWTKAIQAELTAAAGGRWEDRHTALAGPCPPDLLSTIVDRSARRAKSVHYGLYGGGLRNSGARGAAKELVMSVEAIAGNPVCPPSTLAAILSLEPRNAYRDAALRAAGNPSLPATLIEVLATCADTEMRGAAASNPACPEHVRAFGALL